MFQSIRIDFIISNITLREYMSRHLSRQCAFRDLSNIYDEALFENFWQFLIVDYFRKKLGH